tara:strand:- start:309 stop:515 length:207 start_codon:yes stop_codon:yes gene_type:complete
MTIDLYRLLAQTDKDVLCNIVSETIAEHYGEDAVNDFDFDLTLTRVEDEKDLTDEEIWNCTDTKEVTA